TMSRISMNTRYIASFWICTSPCRIVERSRYPETATHGSPSSFVEKQMPLSNIQIVHQDAALLVINKPTLLLSVPGRAEDNRDCLVTRLQENGFPEARIVHRLDWETSGLIVLARDADSHRELSRQFHDRETEKAYTALCWGQPEQDSGSIDLPLRYDPPTKPRHVVDHDLGKHALTFWRVL